MAEDRWGRFAATAEALAGQAGAAQASAGRARGRDRAAAVTVRLDGAGRVASVEVATDWSDRLRDTTLSDAVHEAIRAATRARLEAWAQAMSDPAAAGPPLTVPTDFADRLQAAATAKLGAEDSEAVLGELLALLQQVEQGLDQVSAQLDSTLNRNLAGRSRDGQVKVTVTGGGEVLRVRYERDWLRHAHALDIGRQTMAALSDAYGKVDRDGVAQLIAGSQLGAAQRAVQDPFGLAHRLRLTD